MCYGFVQVTPSFLFFSLFGCLFVGLLFLFNLDGDIETRLFTNIGRYLSLLIFNRTLGILCMYVCCC
ncbi:hypothetical protein GGS20DRAFT_558718 [Poronia punctata]|nr:hypothetical protein GGS20DRAFT_558718 [Poronia punctata]